MSEDRKKRPLVKAAALVAGAGILGLLIFTAVGNSKAKTAEAAMYQAFADTLGPIDKDSMLKEFPATEQNQVLKDLQIYSVRVGSSLVHQGSDESATKEADKNRQPLNKGLLGDYMRALVKEGGGNAPELSEEVLQFLKDHGDDLQAINTILNESEPPTYLQDVSKGFAAPLPNLLGQLRLQRLLQARIIAADQAGDTDTALETLQASMALNRSIQNRADLISQLIALAVVRYQAASLSQLQSGHLEAAALFADPSYGPDLRRAFRGEFHVLTELAQSVRARDITEDVSGGDLQETLAMRFWASPAGRGWMRKDLAEVGIKFTEAVEDYYGRGSCLTTEEWATVFAEVEGSLEGTTPLTAVAVPNLSTTWSRVAVADRQRELTLRQLRFRAALASLDVLPDTQDEVDGLVQAAGLQTDGVCGATTYRYEITPEGHFRVSLQKDNLINHEKMEMADSVTFSMPSAEAHRVDISS